MALQSCLMVIILIQIIKQDTAEPNLALGKPVSASSSYNSPSKVVDGNLNSHWLSGSCWSSNISGERNPWLSIDLQQTYNVSQVRVSHRSDCCAWRLHDYDIWLSDNGPPLPLTVNSQYKLCKHRPGTAAAGFVDTLNCDQPVSGKYLYISINSTAYETLQLCEVWAYEIAEFNIAQGKPTRASSSRYPSAPANAVDGNANPIFEGGSCWHSDLNKTNPWLSVDLQANYKVSKVRITNRIDCCSWRLHDYDIWLSNNGPPLPLTVNSQYKLCKHRPGTPGPAEEVLHCDQPVIGQYLYLSINSTALNSTVEDVLQPCELEAYGIKGRGTGYSSCESGHYFPTGTTIKTCRKIHCAFHCEKDETCTGYSLDKTNCTCVIHDQDLSIPIIGASDNLLCIRLFDFN